MDRDKFLALLRDLPPSPPPTAAELAELSASFAKLVPPEPLREMMVPPMYGEISVERPPLRVELVEKAKPPKNRGGRPVTAIPPDILIKATAWLGYEGEPDTLVAIEHKIEELLFAEGLDASKSTLERWARKIRDAHRDAQREGS